MSLVIFFGMSLVIFLTGIAVISVTIYQWYQIKKEKKALPSYKDLS